MNKNEIGLIGLGVMGSSLARNLASKKNTVSVYNHTPDATKKFIEKFGKKGLEGYEKLSEFVDSLAKPRKIIIMITAGNPVDQVIESLAPLLSKGDIVIDGGNSHFRDTLRRTELLNKKSIQFIGMGISGGEKGALEGPCMMVGAPDAAWKIIQPIFQKVAAKDFKGKPAIANLGTNGAGHYVKMVHNGIEYGLMQMISEAYMLLKNLYKLDNKKIAEIFGRYDTSDISSYLMKISQTVLLKKESKIFLTDLILDSAKNKGTGKWTSAEALDIGVPLPIITESLFARYTSSEKNLREVLGAKLKQKNGKPVLPLTFFAARLGNALYVAFLLAYAEGFQLLQKGSEEHGFDINFKEVARVWQGGCIIQCKLLEPIASWVTKSNAVLLKNDDFFTRVTSNTAALQKIVLTGTEFGVPLPAFSAALTQLQSITTARLPANLIQGMRDLFGAHTYERTDKKGTFHTDWE